MSKTVASSGQYATATIRFVQHGANIRKLQTVELAVVVAAATLALAPLRARWVEFSYSTAVYPRLERSLTPMSNSVPFAFLDLLLVALVLGVVISVSLAVRHAWQTRTVGRLARVVGHL